jgi:hypothetical protein
MLMLMKALNDTDVTVGGSVGMLMAMGGLENNASIHIDGDASMLMLMKGIKTASSLRVDGEAGMTMVLGPMGGDAIEADASMRLGTPKSSLMVLGSVAGRIEVADTAEDGSIMLTGDLKTGAELSVLGDTGMFGNVSIMGRLDGTIRAPQAGVGNRLSVTGTGSTGTVAPADAFASYSGFTP